MLDGLAQALVLDALDAGARFVGQRRASTSRRYGAESRSQPQAKSSHSAIPASPPPGLC